MGLSYNGINFQYPLTRVNVASPGLDPSNSDQLYTEIRLEVQDVLAVDSLPSPLDVTYAGDYLVMIRHKLTQPRKPLYYDVGSLSSTTKNNPTPIINIPDGRDDGGGPMPDPAAFKAHYNTPSSIVVSWACVVRITDCTTVQGTRPFPLSMRWTDSISFDRYFKATYTREGTCIISSRSAKTIDDIRRTSIAPVVAAGFAREQASYNISRDGLRCDFRFVDGQIRYAPPYPAVDMDITQSETLPLLGQMRVGNVQIRIRGAINASPVDLERLCLSIGNARMFAARPLNAEGRVVGNANFSTRETKDSVEATYVVEYKVAPTKIREKAATGNLWKAIGNIGAGNPIGGLGNLIALNNADGAAKPTQQGANPTLLPTTLPWVGYGTSPSGNGKPSGYLPWADPGGTVEVSPSGVSAAVAIELFAALLQDPCGSAMKTTPFASENQQLNGGGGDFSTSLTTQVSYQPSAVNGGVGNGAAIKSQFSIGFSAFSAIDMPTTTEITDNNALYDWDGSPAVYDFWQCQNEYIDDPGTLVLPVCNPDGTNIAVNPTSPSMILRKKWAARRVGALPVLPPKTPSDNNYVYIGGIAPAIRELGVASDGVSICYEASGIYEYQLLNPRLAIPVAEIPPFLNQFVLSSYTSWTSRADPSLPSFNVSGGGTPGGSGGLNFPALGGSSPLGSGGLLNTPPN